MVVSVIPTEASVPDGRMLISLLGRVHGFTAVRVDGAYSSRINARFVHDGGAPPYLKPSRTARGASKGCPAWREMMLSYERDGEEWQEEYRRRWMVESVFSSVKRRLNPFLFSVKAELLLKETMLKFLVHNLTIVGRGSLNT